MTATQQPWGRAATFGLGLVALLAGQIAALAVLTWWYGVGIAQLPDFTGDGIAVILVIVASNPVQVALLALFARMRSDSAAHYLGLVIPRRSEVNFGVAAVIAFIVAGDLLSLLLGRNIVTSFQSDIYRTASASGALLSLWFGIVVIGPIGEEILFRGFLFRGWLRQPRHAWVVIGVTAAMWALMHVQYDWFVIGQVFASGLLLGWLRWASGSTLLTIFLHSLVNLEGMLEALLAFHG